MRLISKVFLTYLLLGSLAIQLAQAEHKSVMVRVRALVADDVRRDNSPRVSNLALPQELSDLNVQLHKLPFNSYRLMSLEEKSINIREKETMRLANGDTLILRPLSSESGKVSLWVRWDNKEGDMILDTRLHFEPGESMIAGTERTKDSSVVLAIDVALE